MLYSFFKPIDNLYPKWPKEDRPTWTFRTTGHAFDRALERICDSNNKTKQGIYRSDDNPTKITCVHDTTVWYLLRSADTIYYPTLTRLLNYVYADDTDEIDKEQLKTLYTKHYTVDEKREQRSRFVMGTATIGLYTMIRKDVISKYNTVERFIPKNVKRALVYFRTFRFVMVLAIESFSRNTIQEYNNIFDDFNFKIKNQHYLAIVTMYGNKHYIDTRRTDQYSHIIDTEKLAIEESAYSKDRRIIAEELFDSNRLMQLYENTVYDNLIFQEAAISVDDKYEIKALLINDEDDHHFTTHSLYLRDKRLGKEYELYGIVI